MRAAWPTTTLATVAALAAGARRIVSVCSGAFLLAAAGLLDGRRVTTHWARAGRLAADHPAVHVDADPIWTRDGDVWTSAGVTAGIDVSLALVEDDHDVEVAETVARWLVMFLRRPGTQSQFATPVRRRQANDEPIRRAQHLIDADPADDHRLGRLAARVAMSERHLLRRFSAELGVTPARYVATARVEAARRELEETDETVAAIAARVGFGTSESMRRTFVRHLGTPPDDYRRRFARHRTRTTTTSEGPAPMTSIAIPLFPRFTALDGIGPYEVLQRIPGFDITFVGHRRGVVRSDNGFLGIEVDATFDELPAPDVVVFPGG